MISLGSDSLRQSNLVAKDEFRPVAFSLYHSARGVACAICRQRPVSSTARRFHTRTCHRARSTGMEPVEQMADSV
jgi:hypothetical protein